MAARSSDPHRDTCKPHCSRRLARPTTQRQQVADVSCTPPRGPGLAVGEPAHQEAVKLQQHQCEYGPRPSIRRPAPHLPTRPQVELTGRGRLKFEEFQSPFARDAEVYGGYKVL